MPERAAEPESICSTEVSGGFPVARSAARSKSQFKDLAGWRVVPLGQTTIMLSVCMGY